MKKMSTLLMVLVLTTLSLISHAQTSTGKVAGHVIDGSQKIIASATITLLKAKDSSVAKIGAANKDGNFVFEGVAGGRYLVSISAVGHRKAYSDAFELAAGGQVDLKTIELIPTAKELSAVTVTGRRPLIEQHIDRMVVNVDAAVTNVGATALEVLEKSPGITLDKDGNISLKGKQGVQVFIDGRPSYLGGADLVNLLSNMKHAAQLDQIEIMTNPPAKYDAAGNSGIINIKTKKNKVKGFNGNATVGYSQAFYWRTNESINMNYRNGKFNAFMNYSYNRNKQWQELDIHRIYKASDGKTVIAQFDQAAIMPRTNSNNSLKLGLDYFLDKKTTLGVMVSGFINPSNQDNRNTSYLKDANDIVDSIVKSTSVVNNTWKNGAVNLNFRHDYDSAGRQLTFDLDYSSYASASDQRFVNSAFYPDMTPKSETDLVSNLPVDINIYSAKTDYTHPLGKDTKLEAGLKSSYVNTDNAANYFNLIGGSPVPDYGKTNRFKYTENINAAYINMNRQIKKIGIQAGLRFENTNYKGHQLGNPQKPNSSFNRTYNNLFPTVFISYAANKNNQFGLSLGRRIDRPAYQDLNPFLNFIDNYTYEAGNPFLQPQYSNNAELSHTYKNFLTTTVNYSRTTNFFSETFRQQDYATIVSRGNIGVRQNAGLSLNAQIPATKWWTSGVYVNYNYNTFKGPLYGEMINISASNVLLNINNQFHFSKGWSGEISGFYRSRGVEGQIAISPMSQVSAGISKLVMKGKGNIRLDIRDIFFTNQAKGVINFQQTEASFKNTRDSRSAGISFTYRFGKPLKGMQNNRKKGGAEDEQNRVNTGN